MEPLSRDWGVSSLGFGTPELGLEITLAEARDPMSLSWGHPKLGDGDTASMCLEFEPSELALGIA